MIECNDNQCIKDQRSLHVVACTCEIWFVSFTYVHYILKSLEFSIEQFSIGVSQGDFACIESCRVALCWGIDSNVDMRWSKGFELSLWISTSWDVAFINMDLLRRIDAAELWTFQKGPLSRDQKKGKFLIYSSWWPSSFEYFFGLNENGMCNCYILHRKTTYWDTVLARCLVAVQGVLWQDLNRICALSANLGPDSRLLAACA